MFVKLLDKPIQDQMVRCSEEINKLVKKFNKELENYYQERKLIEIEE